MGSRSRLAYLGPEATYTHQAAYDRFSDGVEYIAQDTIAEVFRTLSSEVPLALIPRENSIFGPVAETFDILRSSEAGRTKFIREELTFEIRHCLVVPQGIALKDIRRVLSHEQALGQCSRYLTENLPSATLVKVSSTAAAARTLISADSEAHFSAAICSRLCVHVYRGLEVLEEGIQNEPNNFTRFWLFSFTAYQYIPRPCQPRLMRHLALLRLSLPSISKPDSEGALDPVADITHLVKSLPSPAADIGGNLFTPNPRKDSIYFIEISEKARTQDKIENETLWVERLNQNVAIAKQLCPDVSLLGSWIA